MKRALLYVLIILFATLETEAKERFKPEFWLGTSHGVTLSSVTLNPKVKQGMLKGYNGGIAMRYISEKNFGIQAELNYSMRGWEEAMEKTPQYAYARRMSYIELPFLTHMYFGNKTRGFINAGPKIGYFLSEKETYNFDPTTALLSIKEQYGKKTEQKFDYGLCIGGGVEFGTGIGHFGLEGRYYLGLGDFFQTSSTTFFNAASMQTISINLVYLAPLTKKK
ncbi:MAG: porin family protein [Bacteroidales bacterium]|nr:porin family protein [Bacteroidales bacterium]